MSEENEGVGGICHLGYQDVYNEMFIPSNLIKSIVAPDAYK